MSNVKYSISELTLVLKEFPELFMNGGADVCVTAVGLQSIFAAMETAVGGNMPLGVLMLSQNNAFMTTDMPNIIAFMKKVAKPETVAKLTIVENLRANKGEVTDVEIDLVLAVNDLSSANQPKSRQPDKR